jgi:hypothetical protein
MLVTPFCCQDPQSIRHWWLVAHMLTMAALEIGHPIAKFVQVISNNGLLQSTNLPHIPVIDSSAGAEKARQLRSQLIEILNVPLEGTIPVSFRLRPCWTNFLSILQGRCSYSPKLPSHRNSALPKWLFRSLLELCYTRARGRMLTQTKEQA